MSLIKTVIWLLFMFTVVSACIYHYYYCCYSMGILIWRTKRLQGWGQHNGSVSKDRHLPPTKPADLTPSSAFCACIVYPFHMLDTQVNAKTLTIQRQISVPSCYTIKNCAGTRKLWAWAYSTQICPWGSPWGGVRWLVFAFPLHRLCCILMLFRPLSVTGGITEEQFQTHQQQLVQMQRQQLAQLHQKQQSQHSSQQTHPKAQVTSRSFLSQVPAGDLVPLFLNLRINPDFLLLSY